MKQLDLVYVALALLFHLVLVVHFALRKWRFELSVRHGWNVYALGIPAAAVSVMLLLGGLPWSMWLAGFLWLAWGAFGYWVEYLKGIRWRSPLRWRVAGPYLLLYLATCMFTWWPLGLIDRRLWYVAAGLFALSTGLNLASHKGASTPAATP